MPDNRDPNILARQLADLRDEMETLRSEVARAQENWLVERARLEAAAGMTVDDIPEHLWEDGPRIAQACLDRVWDAGFRDGLQVAGQKIHALLKELEQQ